MRYNLPMSRRFQFSLKWLFVAMLVVGAFFGGIHFEREWRKREDEARKLVPEFKLSREAAAIKAQKKALFMSFAR